MVHFVYFWLDYGSACYKKIFKLGQRMINIVSRIHFMQITDSSRSCP